MAGYALSYKNYVLYVCSCSQKVAIDDLYFCHHCRNPRCNDCVSTVVDNSCISCPHCFEAVPQADTRNKKNKCTHCFQCPLCGSTLTSRFVVKSNETADQSPEKTPDQPPDKLMSPEKRKSIAVSSPLNRGSPKTGGLARSSLSSSNLKSPGTKLYYLSCTHCRWSTRDVGIPDKKSPLDFKERPYPGQEKFTELISYYKSLDLQDRTFKEQLKRQQAGRKVRNYSGLLDTSKFKRELSPKHTATLEKTMSIAEDPDPLPDEFYTSPVSMETVTGISQRFRDPAHQPASIDKLWPRPLSLIGKKLHRCKGCDHILLKADVNLNSIRFKINQLALYTIPRVRIVHVPKLILDQPVVVPVSFTNPVSHPVKLSFEPYPDVKRLKEKICFPVIPEGEFTLSDIESIDVVMDDNTSEGEGAGEGSTYILSQEPGKLVLKFGVLAESFDIDSKIAFVVKYSYISTLADDDTEHVLEIPVLLNCGRSTV